MERNTEMENENAFVYMLRGWYKSNTYMQVKVMFTNIAKIPLN